jgi:hypothetical protein
MHPTDEERIMIEGEILHRSTTPNVKHSPLQAILKVPGPDLSKVKYKPLPSIQQPSSKPSTAGDPMQADAVEFDPPEAPGPVNYFVGIRAQSHHLDEFRQLFGRFETYFRPRRTGYPFDENMDVTPYRHMKELFLDAMDMILNDLLQDPTIQALPEVLIQEPIPYYRPREDDNQVHCQDQDKAILEYSSLI